LCASGTESQGYSMPPRTTQESHRPRVSDRTMVGTWQPLRLSVSEPDGVVTNRKMKLLGWEKISSLATSRDEPSSWDRKPEQNQNLLVRERSEEHTSELQSRLHLVCRLLLEKKKQNKKRRERVR